MGMELLMILYTEEQLQMLYKIYAKHQGLAGIGFVKLEDFRKLFEEQVLYISLSVGLDEVM